jgi:hypothetical protein
MKESSSQKTSYLALWTLTLFQPTQPDYNPKIKFFGYNLNRDKLLGWNWVEFGKSKILMHRAFLNHNYYLVGKFGL